MLGLIIAVKNIDEVVKIIKTSEDTSEAKRRLMERFNLSERQAQAILDMRLARLTSLEVYKLEQELKEVQELIKKLTEILGSKRLQFDIVKNEMLEIKKKFKDPRRTTIISNEKAYKVEDLESLKAKATQNIYVALTENGNLKSMQISTYSGSSKVWTDKSGLHESHKAFVKTLSNKKILLFTNLGNAFKIDIEQIPMCKWKEKGESVAKLVKGMLQSEKPVAIFEYPETESEQMLLFFTKQGMIKKTKLSEYNVSKASFQAAKLKDDDEIISVEFDKPDTTIMFITKNGMGLNAEKTDIPEQGRVSGGVKGVNLSDGDFVVSANQVVKGQNIVLISNTAYAKQINTSEFDVLARYRKGVKAFDLKGLGSSGTEVLCSGVFEEEDEILVETSENDYVAISISTIKEDTKTGKGKSLSVETKQILSAKIKHNS